MAILLLLQVLCCRSGTPLLLEQIAPSPCLSFSPAAGRSKDNTPVVLDPSYEDFFQQKRWARAREATSSAEEWELVFPEWLLAAGSALPVQVQRKAPPKHGPPATTNLQSLFGSTPQMQVKHATGIPVFTHKMGTWSLTYPQLGGPIPAAS